MTFEPVTALLFDVFGTVVDWRTAVIREGRELQPELEWPSLADRWRRLYRPTLARVTSGELAWASFDALQRMMLDQVLDELPNGQGAALTQPQRARLTTVWERLDPWPDAAPGLARLKQRFVVCPLSNGSVWQLIQLARAGNLAWDAILSVELFHAYKPDPRVYTGAVELLQLRPQDVLMVAAHVYDLRAARASGLRTAFVTRPREWGPTGSAEACEPGEFDLMATDVVDLAAQLDA